MTAPPRERLAAVRRRRDLLTAEARRVATGPCPECGYGGAPFFAWGHRDAGRLPCPAGEAVALATSYAREDLDWLIGVAGEALR